MKIVTSVYIDGELKEWAKNHGLVLSHILERGISAEMNTKNKLYIKKKELEKLDWERIKLEDEIRKLEKMEENRRIKENGDIITEFKERYGDDYHELGFLPSQVISRYNLLLDMTEEELYNILSG